MKDLLKEHFDKILEIGVLVFIFVFAAIMLAYVKSEEMARWIENGAVITILARAFGTPKPAAPDTITTVSSKTVDPTKPTPVVVIEDPKPLP